MVHVIQETHGSPLRIPPTEHLLEPVWATADTQPTRPMLAHRVGDRFVEVSAEEVRTTVRALSAGLIALGVSPGDRGGHGHLLLRHHG